MFSYKVLHKAFKKGDVIISHCPYDIDRTVCKRIAAVEGETVVFGKQQIIVPRGHVWLLGDNVNNSTDSRFYGAVPTQLIIGRVVLKVFPSWFKPFEIVYSKFPPLDHSISSINVSADRSTRSEKDEERNDTSTLVVPPILTSSTTVDREKSAVDHDKSSSSANDR